MCLRIETPWVRVAAGQEGGETQLGSRFWSVLFLQHWLRLQQHVFLINVPETNSNVNLCADTIWQIFPEG